jgi:hypothetical protein
MDDVVEQGESERRGPPDWLRGVALLAAVLLAVLIVTRTDVLSSEPKVAAGAPSVSAPVGGLAREPGYGVIIRNGLHLERYDAAGHRRLATLPAGFPRSASLVHAQRLDDTGPLVGVNQTVLFRASPARGRRVTAIGRADRVIAASRTTDGVYVLQTLAGTSDVDRVVEINSGSGEIVDDEPFPGFADAAGWRAADVVPVGVGLSALLLTRDVDGDHVELALAWDGRSVRTRAEPRLIRIGTAGSVLGVTDGRVFTRAEPGTCPAESCLLTVITVTGDGVRRRTVEPPIGWVFGAGFAVGDEGDPVVGVARADDAATLALARLVAGGRRALPVPDSTGRVRAVTPIGGPDGSVVFGVLGRGSTPAQRRQVRVALWRPDDPRQSPVIGVPPLSDGAELICVCR